MNPHAPSYGHRIWNQYRQHTLGMIGLAIVVLFVLAGVYAPFLASSKPIVLFYEGQWYFPLFRYLFFRGFYTTALDQFFNLLMFTLPLGIAAFRLPQRWRSDVLISLVIVQMVLFVWLMVRLPDDPASDPILTQSHLASPEPHTWEQELAFMTPYGQLNLVLEEQQLRRQHERLQRELKGAHLYTLWQSTRNREAEKLHLLGTSTAPHAQAEWQQLLDRRRWLEAQQRNIRFAIMPLIRPYHWQEDAGGDDRFNQRVSWWELTRAGHQDLTAALIFGVRVSLVVGWLAVGIALAIGIPIGALSGYYGGWVDIAICRLMEIWEAMPTFFMLLFVVAVLQTKSIFLVIVVIGIFGWTGFSRYLRGEFFKQRNLPYVEACHALGFNDTYIMFRHILPNAIPPVLTLLPFAIMGAIATESGLSFLGLGEAGSCSWGVLMDEGRQSFPAQSDLLWPPAILLTVLLVAIALVGDALRDAIDPRMTRATD